MDVELEFEEDIEVECPKCKHKFKEKVTGITQGDIEPPERNEGYG